MGPTFLQAAASPLTKTVQAPSFMRRAVPLIGQSRSVAPACFNRRSARSLSGIGKVLVSIATNRDFDPRFVPLTGTIFSTTSSSAATDGKDVITTSTLLATFAHDERERPPALFRRCRAAGCIS